jgi:hypothetical protein
MPSDRRLVRDITRLARKQLGGKTEVRFDQATDALFIGEARVQLGNIRRVWSQLGSAERSEWLAGVVANLAQPSPIPEVLNDTSSLRFGLRSRTFVEATRLMSMAKGSDPVPTVHRPLFPALVQVLLWDTPTTMATVTRDAAAGWGRSDEELFDIAGRNIAALPRLGFAAIGDKVFSLINNDDYDSSRLLVDDVLAELPLTGDLIGCIPTRNTLIVAAADDEEAVRIACELALSTTDDTPVFKHPLVRRDGEWALLDLDPEHPAYRPWRSLVCTEHAEAANNIQQLVQSIVGEEVFVASVMLRENVATGHAETVCAWTQDVPTLLPETDRVGFVTRDGKALVADAPWDLVRATVGDLMEPTNHYPARWRVSGFPTAAQLSELAGPG